MHNLRRFYQQNKQKIWKIILIVGLVLGFIYFLNSLAIQNKNSKITSNSTSETYHYDDKNNIYISGQAAISGQNITKTEVEKINNTISQFIEYCKKRNYEEAYKLLTDDCKENRYNTLEKFTEEYAKVKFKTGQTYEIKKWESSTYQVEISEDILASGNANNEAKQVEYITIQTKDRVNKLNINGYIGKENIGIEKTQNDVRIRVVDKQVYMDYEIYNFEIENLSNQTIKLDSIEKTGTIYLKNRNGNKHKAYMNEILDDQLEISARHNSNLNIKFANAYDADREIKSVTFENLIIDYVGYQKSEDKKNFKAICQFTIDLIK